MNSAKALNRNRSALAPVMSAGVMTANMSWKQTNTTGGMVCPAAPV